MCHSSHQLLRMDPYPHCQHVLNERRLSLCTSSRHLNVATSFCFKLTSVVISAGYPVSKELYILQLFSFAGHHGRLLRYANCVVPVYSQGWFLFFLFLLGNLKEHVRVWLLILKGKRAVTVGSPFESSLKDRFPKNGKYYSLGMLQGQVKLHGQIPKEIFKYTEKLSSSLICLPVIFLEMKFCQKMNSANVIFKSF